MDFRRFGLKLAGIGAAVLSLASCGMLKDKTNVSTPWGDNYLPRVENLIDSESYVEGLGTTVACSGGYVGIDVTIDENGETTVIPDSTLLIGTTKNSRRIDLMESVQVNGIKVEGAKAYDPINFGPGDIAKVETRNADFTLEVSEDGKEVRVRNQSTSIASEVASDVDFIVHTDTKSVENLDDSKPAGVFYMVDEHGKTNSEKELKSGTLELGYESVTSENIGENKPAHGIAVVASVAKDGYAKDFCQVTDVTLRLDI